MLFTVHEARALKPKLAQIKDLRSEYKVFNSIITVFSIWIFILATIRAFVVSTIIVSLFRQEQDLTMTWISGEGIGFFFVYVLITSLPLIGDIVNIIVPFVVVIATFIIGDGIVSNFGPFVLPIAIAYAVTFGLVFFSNYLANTIIATICPKIYKEIQEIASINTELDRFIYDSGIQYRNSAFETTKKTVEDKDNNRSRDTETVPEKEFGDEYYDDTF